MKTSILFSLVTTLSISSISHAQNPERHPIYEPSLIGYHFQSDEQNLFAGAKISCSGHFGSDKPELAIDGKIDKEKYWGCENTPVWFQLDLTKPTSIRTIHLWLHWSMRSVYTYKIEGSLDGKSWEMLVDQSANSIAATADGSIFKFAPKKLRFVKITIFSNSNGNQRGGHIVEIKGYGSDIKDQMQVTALRPYARTNISGKIPHELQTKEIKLSAWRGERCSGQVAISSTQELRQLRVQCSPLRCKGKQLQATVNMMRYTKAKGTPIADIIGKENHCDLIAGQIRPIWVEINVPANATPGLYKGELTITAANNKTQSLPISIQVHPFTLPAPKNWKIHLDLWQHPEALARWHDVPPWSDEHFALLKPIMKRLADSGQKAITCSLIDEAWNGQTYDWWPSMIEWRKDKNGIMRWNYTNFDKWVNFMINEVGITGQISCYTMVPWSMKLRYFDETTNTYIYQNLNHNDPSYEQIWGPFLKDFRNHVQAKGWLDKTCISLDERPDALVLAAKKIIEKYAPEFNIVSAIDRPSNLTKDLYDISPALGHANTVLGDLLKDRQAKGKKTTFYVCCNPQKPNTFTHSGLAEAEWLPLYAAAQGLDGFLRWAYNSWNRNPFESTDFGNWPTGDCFLVYPGNLSSPRFEMLRDGIEEFEKIQYIRSIGKKYPKWRPVVEKMNAELKRLFPVKAPNNGYEKIVTQARSIIQETAQTMQLNKHTHP